MRSLGSRAGLALRPGFPDLGEAELELLLREVENTSPSYEPSSPQKHIGACCNQ